MSRVQPLQKEYWDEGPNDATFVNEEGHPCCSIKFLLTLLMCFLVVVSISSLSVIWISSFGATVGNLSADVRHRDFDMMVNSIENMLDEVLLLTESVKGQLREDFDFYNLTMVERHIYRSYKVAMKFLPTVTTTVYVAHSDGSCFGMINLESGPMYTIASVTIWKRMIIA